MTDRRKPALELVRESEAGELWQGRTQRERMELLDELWIWGCIWLGFAVFCLLGNWGGTLLGWWE